jgi:hypothetical protein
VRCLLIALVSCLVLASPAVAADRYTLDNDGAGNLLVRPGDRPTIAVKYTAVCLPFGCNSGLIISSADDATPFANSTGCTANTAASFTCDPIPPRTQVTGTEADDSVAGVCMGSTGNPRNAPLDFDGRGGDDEVSAATCTDSVLHMGAGNDRALGSGQIFGGLGNDVLRGGPGDDSIDGGPGNDLLIGGPGSDLLHGGSGIDTGSFEDKTASQPVTVTLNNLADDGQTGGDNVASDVENVTGGDGGDTITGDAGSNVLQGGDGGDVIDGGGGLDFLDGGPGNDRLLARDGAQDRVSCGDGNDAAVVDAFDTVDGCETVDSSRALMPDVDADGVPAPADCADLDPARRPGFRDAPGNGVDEDCTGADAPFARVLSSVQSQFLFGRVTRFTLLAVRGVPEAATVELRCGGGRAKGCFTGVKRFRFPKGRDTADIRGPVRRSRLRPGARLEIRIVAPESVGKVVQFTIRRGKGPRQRVLCLAPGRKAPARCS